MLAWVKLIGNELIVNDVGFYSQGPETIAHDFHKESPLTVAIFEGESYNAARKKAFSYANSMKSHKSTRGQLYAFAVEPPSELK